MERLSFTRMGDAQDKLDTFITDVKKILKNSNFAEKITDTFRDSRCHKKEGSI